MVEVNNMLQQQVLKIIKMLFHLQSVDITIKISINKIMSNYI